MTYRFFNLTQIQRCAALFLIAFLVIGWMMTEDVSAYERKVLFEDFTSTTCPPCASFAPTMERYLDELGDLVAPIAFHVWWPGDSDPWWQDNQDENRTRVQYYGVRAVPTLFCDGTVIENRNNMLSIIRNRAEVESPLSILLDGSIIDDILNVNVEVTSDDDLNNQTLFVALTEEHVEYRAVNNWMDHYDAMVKMIPGANGTSFSIEAEETLEFDLEQDMDGLGWHELEEDNLILVAWVQTDDREVLQAENYIFSFSSPRVFMTEWTLDDEADGNGDGRAEPGETVDMIVTLELPDVFPDAESVEVHLTCEDDGIEVTVGDFEYGELLSGEEITNEDSPLRFRVTDDFEAHPVSFTVTVMAQPDDWVIDYELNFMVDWPSILLVDATENENATEAMRGLFGEDELPYVDYIDLIQEVVIPEGLLTHYEAVIWHTFNDEDVEYFDFEVDNLATYLDDGGTFILSSSRTCIEYGDASFFRDYLGAQVDDAELRARYVAGYFEDPNFSGAMVFLGGGDGAGFPEATPTLIAEDDAEPVLFYSDGGENIGIAGVKHETDTYKTLLLAFPIESIGGVGNTEERDVFVGRIWAWINGESGFVDDSQIQPATFSLDPAYPNPFNSMSVVPFNVNCAGQVTLIVYDISGREVVRLVDDVYSAGSHRAALDASKAGLTTGLYYLKLTGSTGSRMGKVLYIR